MYKKEGASLMNKAKTLVILTVPRIGKTWYKDNYDKCVAEDSPMKFPLVFDMGIYDDRSIKDRVSAFLNLVYITRKLHLDSIIMDNYSENLVKLCTKNYFPCYILIPYKEYVIRNSFDIKVLGRMNRYPYKLHLGPDQHLSDRVSPMWNDMEYEDKWAVYDKINMYK